ncbi:MAG: ComF family protein [Casimicrobiaceae bacterium]
MPPRCVLCAAATGGALACAACRLDMPRQQPACPRCGLPSPDSAVCGDCFLHPPPLRQVVAAFRYAFPIDRMVQALKYGGQLALADWFGDSLAGAVQRQAMAGTGVDRMLAMPLATARQRQRGFNQAAEIARRASADLRIPCDDGLRRVRDTKPQASLSFAERTRNLRNAFAATHRYDGQHLALVDDVMTSGATLHAAATALLHAGAQSVDAWVVARTLR